jgi:type I restriction enzyme R subunit
VAVKQIVSEHISGTGVIDIYAEAGVERPDLSLIDEDFIDKFRRSDRPNLQIEMLKRLLSDEIKLVGRRNLVAGRTFSEMLASSVLRYQNHALDAAAVVAELVALAKQVKREHERGAELGLRDDELAFYDAICQNDRAVLEMGDELLKKIARELVDSVRRNVTIDWSEKEQVRARMRSTIRRLLRRHGYPPDKQPAAIELVMHQAELMAMAA